MISIFLSCLCWAFVFVIPSWIVGYSPIEISLGRFFIYGLVCFIWLLLKKRHLVKQYSFADWRKAATYGFASTLLCYTGMVCGMRYASPAISTLIYAMSPITIALFGNFKNRTFSYKKFIIPSLLMLIGIVVSNITAFQERGDNLLLYILGLIGAFVGLGSWTWYAVDNAAFLNKRPDIKVNDWSTMMGSSTFILVLFLSILGFLGSFEFSHFFDVAHGGDKFIIGSLVLGIVSTGLAFYFWNQGTKKLPISLIGMLMMLEVVLGLVLIYLFEKRLPSFLEGLGITCMLSGVLVGCRSLIKAETQEIQSL
ncbi:MAG: DMT family transporter [Chlamydiae bacterium]|nr:DMT family transporter [Chlamydiota bacterium]